LSFEGFAPEALAFLGEIAQRQDRAWFAENRATYDRLLLEPERAFVAEAGARLQALDPRVQAVPQVNASLFRIYRDTRFSRDKSPFKTYSDIWFWIGLDRKTAPGYFIRLEPTRLLIGGGAHRLTAEQIARMHAAIDAPASGESLAEILRDAHAAGYAITEQQRKSPPRGFSADHPRAELLRYTDMHAIRAYEPPPRELASAEFVEWSMERFAQVRPLVEWLVEHVG
jgi:uncharacterized protein (TIGR02453 family)